MSLPPSDFRSFIAGIIDQEEITTFPLLSGLWPIGQGIPRHLQGLPIGGEHYPFDTTGQVSTWLPAARVFIGDPPSPHDKIHTFFDGLYNYNLLNPNGPYIWDLCSGRYVPSFVCYDPNEKGWNYLVSSYPNPQNFPKSDTYAMNGWSIGEDGEIVDWVKSKILESGRLPFTFPSLNNGRSTPEFGTVINGGFPYYFATLNGAENQIIPCSIAFNILHCRWDILGFYSERVASPTYQFCPAPELGQGAQLPCGFTGIILDWVKIHSVIYEGFPPSVLGQNDWWPRWFMLRYGQWRNWAIDIVGGRTTPGSTSVTGSIGAVIIP